MRILRANVYRLEPTDEQALFLSQTAGACRFVYNLALEQRRDWHRPGRNITYLSQRSEITALRAEVAWLAAAPVHALQMAVWAVDTAFQRFFMGLGGYPQPRKKFLDDRFTFPDPSKLGFKRLNKNRAAVKLPKIGSVKLVGYRPIYVGIVTLGQQRARPPQPIGYPPTARPASQSIERHHYSVTCSPA
jgi:putative transposase